MSSPAGPKVSSQASSSRSSGAPQELRPAPLPTNEGAALPPLPAELDWCAEDIQALARPAACLRKDSRQLSPLGGTRCWGVADIPADAPWAAQARHWDNSPYDGQSFWLQLNLEDIPSPARAVHWPQAGVVWVVIDLSGEHWEGQAYFDPRPASAIPWRPRPVGSQPMAASWTLQPTLSCATEKTLPQVYHWPHMCEVFDDWAAELVRASLSRSLAQVGGWAWPIQGDNDERNEDFVAALEHQPFGDSGAVYLHYNAERGFYVLLDSR